MLADVDMKGGYENGRGAFLADFPHQEPYQWFFHRGSYYRVTVKNTV